MGFQKKLTSPHTSIVLIMKGIFNFSSPAGAKTYNSGTRSVILEGKGIDDSGLVSKEKIEFEGISYWTDESIKAEVTYQSPSLTPLRP
jgi:hypothetical protein